MAPPYGSGPPWWPTGIKPQGVPPDTPGRLAYPQPVTVRPYIGGTGYGAVGSSPNTFGLPCAVGSGILVFGQNGGSSPTTVTDTVGNFYEKLGNFSTGGVNVFAWFCRASKGTNPTITVTTGTTIIVMGFEVVGQNGSFFIDGYGTHPNTTTGPTFATSTPNSIFLAWHDGPPARTAPAGYNKFSYNWPGASTAAFCWSATPVAQGSKFPGWSGTAPGLVIALRSGQYNPDHTPIKGEYSPLPPWTPIVTPAVRADYVAPATPDVTLGLSGQTGTFSEGTISDGTSYSLTGQSATLSEGTISDATSYALTAQTGTFTEGVISQQTDTTTSLSGQTASFSEGAATLSLSLNLGAIVISTTEGTMTVTGGDSGGGGAAAYVGFICNVGSLMNH